MEHILSLIIIFPALAAFLGMLVDEKSIRTYGICMSLIEFILTIFVWFKFDTSIDLNFIHQFGLISDFGVSYIVGIDGISLFLVILSAFVTMVCLIALSIKENLKHLIISILFLEMAIMGAFLSLDAILFYIFWELTLIPVLYIIGAWGGKDRIYASLKFFIYTFFGSLLMLVGILAMAYFYHKIYGIWSFSLLDWTQMSLPYDVQIWLFLSFFIAFAVKIPIFPFHSWLPYAYTQAPIVGVIMLSSLLLKMGTYGLVRFLLPLFPQVSINFSFAICVFATIMVIYAALIAFSKDDIKEVLTYASASHANIIVLGIFAMNEIGLSGAVFFMVSHGIVGAGMFILVGGLYDRRGSFSMSEFGGLAKTMPKFAFIFALLSLANVGAPLTSGFIGEFLSIFGIFKNSPWIGFFASLSIVLGSIYTLNMFRRLFFGRLIKDENKNLKDASKNELFAVVPICILVVFLGIYPRFVINPIQISVEKSLSFVKYKDERELKLKENNDR